MKKYETKKFDSMSELRSFWDKLSDNLKHLKLSPYYSFRGYRKGSFQSYSLVFQPNTHRQIQDLEELGKEIELFEIYC